MESFQSNSLLEGVKDMDTLVILVAGSANMSSVLKMAVVYHANLSIPWSRRDRPTAPWLNFVAKQRATPHTIRWEWWQFINADIQQCPMRENDNISLQSERALTNRVHVKNPSLVCGAEIQARLETEIQARLESWNRELGMLLGCTYVQRSSAVFSPLITNINFQMKLGTLAY